MATRLDKIMEPILKEKCDKAFKAGYEKGFANGFKNKSLAYENDIKSLKYLLNKQRFLLKENGEIIPLDQRWIPVAERLPESEKCVLVYSKDGGVAEGKYNARFNEWVQFRWNVTNLRNVTHWMPLPEPPEGE